MRINKTHFLLILIIFVVFFGLMATLIPGLRKKNISSPTFSVQEISEKMAILSFRPQTFNLTNKQEFTTDVFLKTDKKIVSADLEIMYDPKILIFQEVNKGEFLPEGQIISQKIDEENGTILVGLVSFQPASGNGNLVALKFRKQNKEEGTTKLTFGEKTQIYGPEGESIPFEITTNKE